MPAQVFREAFARLEAEHEIRYEQIDEDRVLEPGTPSERAIREYAGHPGQLVDLLYDDDVLVVHGAPVTDAVLDAAPRLSLVCCARGGPVNVDVGAATQRGLPVATTPGKNAEAVADLTVAFLVMLARQLPTVQRFLVDRGRIGDSTFEGAEFLGHDLGGRLLGLVGFGQVGRRVAARAQAFGMTVLVHDPYVNGEPAEGVERVGRLDDLLRRTDFVSVHARATAETENLFDAAAFAAMRAGAFFVNTARETFVDEDALLAALRSGHLAGAALDVLRRVAPGARHPLVDAPGVIVTPHIGGATHETLVRGAEMLAGEIERLAVGDAPYHVVNREALVRA
jgi:D-3-phosphoglycerate dehydrogenase / 2-oxoglutarate reductase